MGEAAILWKVFQLQLLRGWTPLLDQMFPRNLCGASLAERGAGVRALEGLPGDLSDILGTQRAT